MLSKKCCNLIVLKYKELQTTIAIITETKLLNYFVLQMIFTSFLMLWWKNHELNFINSPSDTVKAPSFRAAWITTSASPNCLLYATIVTLPSMEINICNSLPYVLHSFSARKTVEQNECWTSNHRAQHEAKREHLHINGKVSPTLFSAEL